MIRRISDELHISTDVLIKPTRTLGGPSLNSGSRGHELDISPTAARIGMVEKAPLC